MKVARTYLLLVAAALLAFAVIRLSAVVGNGEGGQCGPGWTTEYSGPCDAALKARQIEVGVCLVLAAVVAAAASRLRPDRE